MAFFRDRAALHSLLQSSVSFLAITRPRYTRRGINSTFFLGALPYGLVHSETAVPQASSLGLILVIFFGVILLGGVFQALFGLFKVGTLLKFTPHPIVADFQATAAALLFRGRHHTNRDEAVGQ